MIYRSFLSDLWIVMIMFVDKIEISEMFKRLRTKLGLTQHQMAESMDIALRFYQSLESGEKEPSFQTILKASHGLKISISEIMGEESSKAIPIPAEQLRFIEASIKKAIHPTENPKLNRLFLALGNLTNEQLDMIQSFVNRIQETSHSSLVKKSKAGSGRR